jgi:osmotically-inducible protein OsmY
MADWNRYRRQDQRDDHDRNYRQGRQSEQFQSDRNYGDEQGAAYGQMGDDYSQGRYGNQQDEPGYQNERPGNSWRDDRSNPSRDRGFGGGQTGGHGRGQYGAQDRSFNSFTSDGFRTGGAFSQRDQQGYVSGASQGGGYGSTGGFGASGGASGGGYGGGSYGSASRRQYGGDDYASGSQDERGFFDRAGDAVASWFGDEDAQRRREQDHRGRGPANYKRSDERILEDACDKLTQDWGVDARNIQVTVQGGEVTLDGTVENRNQKRRAEDVVHDISGVTHVQNNLRAQESSRSTYDQGSGGSTGGSSASERGTTGTLA